MITPLRSWRSDRSISQRRNNDLIEATHALPIESIFHKGAYRVTIDDPNRETRDIFR